MRVCTLALVLTLSLATTALARSGGASGGVRKSDIAATRTYLLDIHALREAEARSASAAQAAAQELIAHVRGQCPNALVGAPASKVIEALRFQALAQVDHAESAPSRAAEIAFAKKVQRLRWSSHKLTYYIHGSAEEERANVELAVPDICTEAKAIAETGYQTVPAAMAQYEREEDAANSKVTIVVRPHQKESGSLEEIIMRMLRPYERSSEKRLIPPRAAEIEKQTYEALEIFFSYAKEVIQALGLPLDTANPATH